jgi:hypothetical protein
MGVAMSADDRNVVINSRSSKLFTIKKHGVTTNAQTSFNSYPANVENMVSS